MSMKRVLALFAMSLVLWGCANQPQQREAAAPLTAWMLLLQESRENEPDATYRYLVTTRYIRIDEGKKDDDYILFDRETRQIFNVVHDDETVFVIHEKAVQLPPEFNQELSLQKNQSHILARDSQQNSSQAFHYQYSYGGEVCYNVVGVKDMAPEVVEALKEYRSVLASELATGIDVVVARSDMCHTLVNIVTPNRIFEAGFPLREWRGNQYQRFLVDYRWDVIVPSELFLLPEKYNQYSTSDN